MKKCKRKTLCASTTNTAQLNAQHNKLHIHENDHRFLFDHRLNGCGIYKSGFTLLVFESKLFLPDGNLCDFCKSVVLHLLLKLEICVHPCHLW